MYPRQVTECKYPNGLTPEQNRAVVLYGATLWKSLSLFSRLILHALHSHTCVRSHVLQERNCNIDQGVYINVVPMKSSERSKKYLSIPFYVLVLTCRNVTRKPSGALVILARPALEVVQSS